METRRDCKTLAGGDGNWWDGSKEGVGIGKRNPSIEEE